MLLAANGAPILGRLLFAERFSQPVDGNHLFSDGQPLFGPSKTWRGIVFALLITPLIAVLLRLPIEVGLLIAVLAMLGDLLSSFIKRRLRIAPSGMALGLDQIPESLLPLLGAGLYFEMDWLAFAELALIFLVLELLLSRVLYWLNIRKQPY
ncbi:MAG: CDP-archaeol synthase [Gammaproteobacteria bacterium]|nr:CDP-archaeol synthase [Gammaproteobacteria bacterium]